MTNLMDYSWEIIRAKMNDVESLLEKLHKQGLLEEVLNQPISIRLSRNLEGENSLLDILCTGKIHRHYGGTLEVSMFNGYNIPLLKSFYEYGIRLTFEQFINLFRRMTKTNDTAAAELLDIIHLYHPEYLRMQLDTENPTWGTPMYFANVNNAHKTKKKLIDLNIPLHYFISRSDNLSFFYETSFTFISFYPRKDYSFSYMSANKVYVHKNDVAFLSSLPYTPYIMFEISKNAKGLRASNVQSVAKYLKNIDVDKQRQFVKDIIEPIDSNFSREQIKKNLIKAGLLSPSV